MKVVGLCGGSGSGKGTVSEILIKLGIPVIDTDAIYHELTSSDTPCLRALEAEFGEVIIKDGALYRPALAKIVFTSENAKEKRAKLNDISHIYVLDEVRKKINKYRAEGQDICVVDIPLLFESGFDRECDITVAVIAESELRIDRIISRDNIDRTAAEARLNSQISNTELTLRTDMQIQNSSDMDSLELSVSEVLKKIRENI